MKNEQLAKDLDVSESMISRMRSGHRRPGVALMLKIQKRLNWPMEAQAYAMSHGNGRYADELNSRLTAEEPSDG